MKAAAALGWAFLVVGFGWYLKNRDRSWPGI